MSGVRNTTIKICSGNQAFRNPDDSRCMTVVHHSPQEWDIVILATLSHQHCVRISQQLLRNYCSPQQTAAAFSGEVAGVG